MLTLPASPERLLREVIEPALAAMPRVFDSPAARCMLLAIALQEGGALLTGRRPLRRQGAQSAARGRLGPARSFWQNELSSVLEVMTNRRTEALAAILLTEAGLPHDPREVHRRLERPDADAVACQLNRLLLWLDPRPLPAPRHADSGAAFEYYRRNWRPGAARTASGAAAALRRWRRHWPVAVALCGPRPQAAPI